MRVGWTGLRVGALVLLAGLGAGEAWGEFTLRMAGEELTVVEDGKPVLVLHGDMVAAPAGVAEHYRRSAYIHPLYGLDGEVLTEDFPGDHYHHRGVFWAWPQGLAGKRLMDVWTLKDARQVFDSWDEREVRDGAAHVTLRSKWVFDDASTEPVLRETVSIVVHPATETGRPIDFTLRLDNVSGQAFTLLGAKDKGYGGFCVRPPAARKPMTFTTSTGVLSEDALRAATPWADVSFAREDAEAKSGMAIFQHPGNPGYPHDGWLMRHYAFLGVAWPHEAPHTIEHGDSLTLRYRLYVHRGDAAAGQVAEAFARYVASEKP